MKFVAEGNVKADGRGLYLTKETDFTVKLYVDYLLEDGGEYFGALTVKFDSDTWRPEDGAPYTDDAFRDDVVKVLHAAGFRSTDIGWSEAGRQCDWIADMDIGDDFARELLERKILTDKDIERDDL